MPHQIFLDIEKAGVHTIHFSMREDGFEFDKWLMTKDRDFKRPAGPGPSSTSNAAKLPTFPLIPAPKLPDVPAPVADQSNEKVKPDRTTSPTKPVSDCLLYTSDAADE